MALCARSQLVPRLRAVNSTQLAEPWPHGASVVLIGRGLIDCLALRPAYPPNLAPRPEELTLRIRAVGLNFRDVLNVLGAYPGEPGAPGADCAGVVLAAGRAAFEDDEHVAGFESGGLAEEEEEAREHERTRSSHTISATRLASVWASCEFRTNFCSR